MRLQKIEEWKVVLPHYKVIVFSAASFFKLFFTAQQTNVQNTNVRSKNFAADMNLQMKGLS